MKSENNQRRTGWLRLVWALLLALIWIAAALVALPLLLGRALSALFDVWNLQADTLARAPVWAQALYGNAGTLVALVSSAALIGAGLLCCRMCGLQARREAIRPRMLLWALPPLGATALALAVDSLRLKNALTAPQTGGAWVALLAVALLTALAEGVWFQRFLYGALVRVCPGGVVRWIVALLFALHAAWRPDATPLLAVNMLLLGALLLRPEGAAAGFALRRFAFLLPGVLVSAPAGCGALYELLDVSEDWLTGGAAGISAGGLMTAILLAILVCENRAALRHWLSAPGKKDEPRPYVSGKRNRRIS